MPFISDTESPVHPEVMDAIRAANVGVEPSYGNDCVTTAMREAFKATFGTDCEAYPVMNGTGANVLSLQVLADRWAATVCSNVAHLYNDECGAAERHATQVLPITSLDGKLWPEQLHLALQRRPVHQSPAAVLSVAQATELGTVYGVDELAALTRRAHALGMAVHVDGARICNAAAALNVSLREITTDVGVDIVSFGGTKNGCMLGECVLILNRTLRHSSEVQFVRKSSMQLISKMRFISAQYLALLENDLWLRNAKQANRMATLLAHAIEAAGLGTMCYPVEANLLFVNFGERGRRRLLDLYGTSTTQGTVRLVTSFDTSQEQVLNFVAALEDSEDLSQVDST